GDADAERDAVDRQPRFRDDRARCPADRATGWPGSHRDLPDPPFYQIINQNSNKCLTPLGNSTSPNALIVQRSCENRASHQWSIISTVASGQFALQNRGSSFCMDLQGQNFGTLVTQSNGLCDFGVGTENWLLVASDTPPYYRLQN